MFESLKEAWRTFRRDPPGQRFEKRYNSQRRKRGGKSSRAAKPATSLLKPLYILAGALLVLAGVFFMAVPGPGIPIAALGAALIAGQSLRAARLLDRLELRLRSWTAKARRRFRERR